MLYLDILKWESIPYTLYLYHNHFEIKSITGQVHVPLNTYVYSICICTCLAKSSTTDHQRTLGEIVPLNHSPRLVQKV